MGGLLGAFLVKSGLIGAESAPITEAEIHAVQKKWGSAIKDITKVFQEQGDFVKAAAGHAGELYGYGHGDVAFKPTKATDNTFRPTAAEAMSYFVGADNVTEGSCGEDKGFAINGGRGWSEVVFENHQIQLHGSIAFAMGEYTFTDATDGMEAIVEYTFGYKRTKDGIRIFLHHSSSPYQPGMVKAKPGMLRRPSLGT